MTQFVHLVTGGSRVVVLAICWRSSLVMGWCPRFSGCCVEAALKKVLLVAEEFQEKKLAVQGCRLHCSCPMAKRGGCVDGMHCQQCWNPIPSSCWPSEWRSILGGMSYRDWNQSIGGSNTRWYCTSCSLSCPNQNKQIISLLPIMWFLFLSLSHSVVMALWSWLLVRIALTSRATYVKSTSSYILESTILVIVRKLLETHPDHHIASLLFQRVTARAIVFALAQFSMLLCDLLLCAPIPSLPPWNASDLLYDMACTI